ncbi:F0F1 ATP synthase subunit B [Nocardia terpenica]|uniref:ATP synthase subunit b n=1 Tax=Nocardia terpenica TaxID=455432 RepID=A0A164JMR7_9NOCA|nr:F0F1 ATP synthase subunit B [Nocardia terpenica]ATL70663.1 F0F1 ATP synthase subunit B [Nocardia terpenica]KZM70553.1 F0F1 ATP synthase subunit B [Nocardia terpenica]MBF6060394.1 F0F1 ATP synthase subunit B [Nocardia terpenica]MBF6103654.1 F0F1 ATP synthase subunit B [Nocardia terpenica]MBF6111972.1 F0F1 ATP synthase subunit B [Nocardia terpenica]
MAARTDTVAEGNFLIPNGTFFVELAIFLIVLAVIWIFVVPPIRKVLEERENRVSETTARGKESKELFAQAQAHYEEGLEKARAEAADIRNRARAEGRAILEELRGEAQREADAIVAEAQTQLRAEADQVAAELRQAVEPLADSLADRVVGGPEGHAGTSSGHQRGRAQS